MDAFVAAREAAGNPERATVYMSDQSHSAFSRAAMVVGARRECIRIVPSDECFRLDMEAQEQAVAADQSAGFNPLAVCANAGTASSGAVDPLEMMADYCAAEGIWLHVDAAYGGFTVVTEQGKRLLQGIERADSIGLDAHKWFFQPYETGCLLVKDESTLQKAFGVRNDVLPDTVWGANHPNFVDRGLQLSRSVRALKVWASIQSFGMAAFRWVISKGMELAAQAEGFVQASSILESLTPATLGIVCLRINPADFHLEKKVLEKINRTVLARFFWEDPAFVSSTSLHGALVLRLCILNHTATWDDALETMDTNRKIRQGSIDFDKGQQ